MILHSIFDSFPGPIPFDGSFPGSVLQPVPPDGPAGRPDPKGPKKPDFPFHTGKGIDNLPDELYSVVLR